MPELEINQINNKQQWEQLLSKHPQANFLQSYNWGLFQECLGKKFFALVITQSAQAIGSALVIKEQAKRGNYLTLAGGPLLDWSSPNAQVVFATLCDYLKTLAQNEHCLFVRIRPQALNNPTIQKIFLTAGLKPAPMHLTADLTLQLNLTLTDEELLAQMRKNTRYEIKKAQRLGLTTQIVIVPNFIDEFQQHQLYLAKKHNFVPFEHEFLKKQFEAFLIDQQVAFVNSYLADQLLASAFVIFYQQEAVYHYGVSTPQNDKLPGAYLAQWQAIQEARRRGCSVYNFWGVSPQDQKNHRFAGVSLFKRGFGGQEVAHLPAHDLSTSCFYGVTKKFELMRKKLRRL